MQPHFNTLIDLFAHNAQAHPEGSAVIFEGGAWSHAEFFQAIQSQAAALAAMGISKGDRVLLLSGNRPEVLVLLAAAAWLGAMLVPLNLRLSSPEIAQQARDATPALAILDSGCAPLWQAACSDGMPGVPVAALTASANDGVLACIGPQFAAATPRQDSPDAGVIMLYTAAIEGHARGAVLSQSQLTASADQTARVWSLGVNDRWLGVLPLFHAAGIGLSLALLAAGGTCVLLPRFDPAIAVQAVDQHRVTVCATFAPMLGALLDAAQTRGDTALRSLRICMGLEPPSVLERLAQLCPSAGFWTAYGQAEVSSMVCLGLQRERPGSAGRAVAPSEVRIQDDHGLPVAVGVKGEIAVSGPTVFLGYWDVQAQRPFKPSGLWHRTGDLGHLDDEGWLWFSGRAQYKQLIKTGGENVYPAEVEHALLEHPAVAEAFVFGQPDEKWGEAVHAACALKPGSHASSSELVLFAEMRLARYKRPQSVRILPAPLDRNTIHTRVLSPK